MLTGRGRRWPGVEPVLGPTERRIASESEDDGSSPARVGTRSRVEDHARAVLRTDEPPGQGGGPDL